MAKNNNKKSPSFKLNDFGKKVESRKKQRASQNNAPMYDNDEPSPEKEKKNGHIALTQWSKIDYNAYVATSKTYKKIPNGFYNLTSSNGVPIFLYRELNVDELIYFPNSLYDTIIQEIKQFWTKKEVFDNYGFLHRRGYLLYGPQGSGKSCMSQLVIKDIIEREGIVINCNCSPGLVDRALVHLREVEPDRKVVCLFEDIDAIVHSYGEDSLLSLLDGENQINTVLNLATTNYPEYLDKRIVARPRRFDRVIKIDMPDDNTRRMYFEKKLKIDQAELNKWVKSTEGFSFAALAELVISVKCFDKPFKEAVEALEELLESRYHSSDFDKRKIGFNDEDDNGGEDDFEIVEKSVGDNKKYPAVAPLKKIKKARLAPVPRKGDEDL